MTFEIATQKNVDPKEIFGDDMSSVFGAKLNRKHIRTLKSIARKKLLKKIPEYVDTDVLGEDPYLFDIANLCLDVLAKSGALKGINLDWQTDKSFQDDTLRRHPSMYVRVSQICKNWKTQRGIQLRHLVADILFNFDPKCVLMGLARYSQVEDKYYLNDAQHRYIACIILGIRHIPLEYTVSELRSDDIIQYAAVNIRSLSASEFDKYRVKVQAVQAKLEEVPGDDLSNFDKDYISAYELHGILSSLNCKMIEKGGTKKPAPASCTGVYNLLRHYEDYGRDTFTRALKIDRKAFHKAPIGTPNIWGICEFINYQTLQNVSMSPSEMDDAIVKSLQHRYNANKNGFHQEAKRPFQSDYAKTYAIPEPLKIAAGLYKLVTITSPDMSWKPIAYSGFENLTLEFMEDYRVPDCLGLTALFN